MHCNPLVLSSHVHKGFSTPDAVYFHPTFLPMCIILAGKAKIKASSWEHRALKLFRCLHGSYLNCTWAFAGSEHHCKGKCMLCYENMNFTTITQMNCPIFIWVEGFILKNKQQKSIHITDVGFPMSYTRICSGVVISDTSCVCLLWRWWGGWNPPT